MNTQMDKWKEEVLQSIGGMHRAEPNPFLLAKIKARINTRENDAVPVFQPAFMRLAVTCLALLIVVNVTVMIRSNHVGRAEREMDYSYGSGLSQTFNLYEE
jgi:hypothetical protein